MLPQAIAGVHARVTSLTREEGMLIDGREGQSGQWRAGVEQTTVGMQPSLTATANTIILAE